MRFGKAKFLGLVEAETIQALDSDGLKLQNTGGDGVLIDDSGLVHIGDTSPAVKRKLNIRATDATAGIRIQRDSVQAFALYILGTGKFCINDGTFDFLRLGAGATSFDNAGTNSKSEISLDTYNDQIDINYISKILLRKSHTDTFDGLVTTLDTELLGYLGYYGVNSGNSFQFGAKILAKQDGSAGATYIPTKLILSTYDDTGENINQLVLDKNKRIGINKDPTVTLDIRDSAGVDILLLDDEKFEGTVFKKTSFINELLNGDFEYWYAGTSSAPDAWTLSGAGATIAREATTIKLNTYSAGVTRNGNDCVLFNSNYNIANFYKPLLGKTLTLSCWVWSDTANTAFIGIGDDVGGETLSSAHTAPSGGAWELLTVTHTIASNASWVSINLRVKNNNDTVYFDGAMLVESEAPMSYTPHAEDHLYRQEVYNVDPSDVIDNTGNSNFDGIYAYPGAGAGTYYAYPTTVGEFIVFPINMPTAIAGKPVVIDEITIYYYTDTNDDYIDFVKVRQMDGDGTQTLLINHNDDLGNGSSGAGSHDIVDSPAEMSDKSTIMEIKTIGASGAINTDVRFYMAVCKYHVKAHN